MTTLDHARQLFGSNLVAMVTPMLPDGNLNEQSLFRLVDDLLATGCDGLVIGATTVESPTLTDAEAGRLVRAVSARADGRARVVAGALAATTRPPAFSAQRPPKPPARTPCCSSARTPRSAHRSLLAQEAL